MIAVREETRRVYQEAVLDAIRDLAGDLDRVVRLESLAERAAMSPFHFHRVFRGMVGETVGEFARRLRMERSALRLTESATPITEIAFEAGYATHEAYTKAFRQAYALSPSEYRQRRMTCWRLAASCGVHFDVDRLPETFVARDTGGRFMQVETIEMPRMRTVAFRHIGPYNQIPEAFGRLCEFAAPRGLLGAPGSLCLALYHDDPETTPPAELRSDACVTIADDVQLPPEVAEGEIPAGRYARTIYLGPYTGLGDAWNRFMGEWLPASGLQFGKGPSFEIYVGDPQTDLPEKLRTDLYISVE